MSVLVDSSVLRAQRSRSQESGRTVGGLSFPGFEVAADLSAEGAR